MTFQDHFSNIAQNYAAFRPTYPPALFGWLATQAHGRALAWDCATGSGQAALGLVQVFDRVVATDASAQQLSQASVHDRITYQVAPAEQAPFADASVDVITVAQALHWFDRAAFFQECERVLKSKGVLAVWTYGPLRVVGADVDTVLQHYYHDIVGAYWPPERTWVEAGYEGIQLPFTEIATPTFEMTADWDMQALLGYLGSWSASHAYQKANGHDPREQIFADLQSVWGDVSVKRRITWSLTLRVSVK